MIGIAFPAHSLHIKKCFVFRQKPVCNFFRRRGPAIGQQVKNQKMKDNVIICKAFGLPYLKQRVGIKEVTVYGKGTEQKMVQRGKG